MIVGSLSKQERNLYLLSKNLYLKYGSFFLVEGFLKNKKTDGDAFTPTENKCYKFMEESGVPIPINMNRLMSDPRPNLSFTVPNCCFIHF